jgi:predicted O-methyltransferase YrrM
VIELGTNVGISSAYLAAGLVCSGVEGRVLTLDSSAYRQRLARQVHDAAGLSNVSYAQGLFVDTLAPSLRELGEVDLAFIDGHHLYQPTLDYFEQILAYAAPDAVLVFDDIHWSDEMKAAWDRLRSDERLGLTVDLETIGLGVPRASWPGAPVRSVIRPGV